MTRVDSLNAGSPLDPITALRDDTHLELSVAKTPRDGQQHGGLATSVVLRDGRPVHAHDLETFTGIKRLGLAFGSFCVSTGSSPHIHDSSTSIFNPFLLI